MTEQPGKNAAPDKTYAIIVGIEKYRAADWELPGPASDARNFSNWLIQMNVPPENIKLFLSPLPGNEILTDPDQPSYLPATKENITDCFYKWLNKMSGDLFWFFWAGHGFLTTQNGIKRRLFFEDADEYYLKNIDLKSLVESMRTDFFKEFKRQIYIIDACARKFDRNFFKGNLDDLSFKTGDNVHNDCKQFECYSAREGELAKNYPKEQIGLFSKELMKEFRKIQIDNDANDTQWPPDMGKVATSLGNTFDQMRIKGITTQIPSFVKFNDWNEKKDYILPPIREKIERILEDNGIPKTKFETLVKAIAEALEQSDIEEAYRKSVPRYFNFPNSPPDASEPLLLLYACLAYLEEAPPGKDGILHPIHKFFGNLANQLESKAKQYINNVLENAVEKVCKDDHVKAEEMYKHLDDIAKIKQSSLHKKGYMLIRLKPLDSHQNNYIVNAWLCVDDEIHQLIAGSEGTKNRSAFPIEKVRKEDMAEHIFNLLNVPRNNFAERDLCLEFFLPRKQITEDIDQWIFPHDIDAPEEIGFRCEVVVRSLERVEVRNPFKELRRRWESIGHISSTLTATTPLETEDLLQRGCYIESDKCDCGRLRVIIRDKPKLVCVLMAREPQIRETRQNDVLNVLLNAGIPIIIWPRNIPLETTGKVKTELAKIIENGKILELPGRIFQLRKDAKSNPKEYWFGRKITLLWDDPNRLPPSDEDYLLGSPEI